MENVPRTVVKALKRIQREGGSAVIDGITVYPPDARGYWRIQRSIAGQQFNRSGGRSIQTAWSAVQRLQSFLEQLSEAPLDQGQSQSTLTVGEVLREYLQRRGPRGRWSDRTLTDRSRDFNKLLQAMEDVDVSDLRIAHLHEWLETAGTHERRQHLANIGGTFLRWAVALDHLPSQARDMADKLKYLATPTGQTRSRRKQQSRSLADATGAIPSHDHVHDWAEQAGKIWAPGKWFIYLLAYTGLRSSEALLVTCDPTLAKLGRGNFLDASNCTVTVSVQQSRQGTPIPPKGGKHRIVAIPNQRWTHGINLQEWIQTLPQEGYAFARSDEDPWLQDAIYRQVFAKASDALAWKLPGYDTLNGKKRELRRFTLHSLRARYATTAINEWGFSRAQLQQQGGWEPGTVERFYQGFDDQTLATVMNLLNPDFPKGVSGG